MNPLHWTVAEWGAVLAVFSVVGVRECIRLLRGRQRTRR